MKNQWFGLAVSGVIFFLAGVAAASEGAKNPDGLPEWGICSHRGANSQFPENTLPAFQEAVRQGAAMIEFDVRFTKDRALVILHDWTVDRTSSGQGNVLDFTLEEIRKLDFGSWKGESFAGTQIPTLAEAFAVIPTGQTFDSDSVSGSTPSTAAGTAKAPWVNVHIDGAPKEIERELALAAADFIVASGRQHQAFLAVNRRMAAAVHEKYPDFLICNMERRGGNDGYIDVTIADHADFIQITEIPAPEKIQALKDAGVRINYFGTNDADYIKRLFDAGIEFPLVDDLPIGMKAAAEWEDVH